MLVLIVGCAEEKPKTKSTKQILSERLAESGKLVEELEGTVKVVENSSAGNQFIVKNDYDQAQTFNFEIICEHECLTRLEQQEAKIGANEEAVFSLEIQGDAEPGVYEEKIIIKDSNNNFYAAKTFNIKVYGIPT